MDAALAALASLFTALTAPLALPGGVSTSWAEVAGFATGAACVWLAARNHIANWPAGIANSAAWLLLFASVGLYADAGLQVVYIAMGAYGWRHWARGGAARTPAPVTSASWTERAVVLALCATATAALAALLAAGTDSRVPLGDAATTVCSLAANFWLARRRTDNWPLWIAGVNAPYFALYLYKGLALTASLQVVFIIFSVIGWRTWRREMAGGARHLPAGALAGGMA